MIKRGYSHLSSFVQPDLSYLKEKANVKVDSDYSISDLKLRCENCRSRILKIKDSKLNTLNYTYKEI